MKHRPFIPSIALLAVLLTTHQVTCYAQQGQDTTVTINKRAFRQVEVLRRVTSPPTTPPSTPYHECLGCEIPSDLAIQCIELYAPTMKKYGIKPPLKRSGSIRPGSISVRKPVNSREASSVRPVLEVLLPNTELTSAVIFGGADFLNWLDRTIYDLDKTGGLHVGVKLMFGIYTEAVLDELSVNATKDEAIKFKKDKKHRITIFVVPYLKENPAGYITDRRQSRYGRMSASASSQSEALKYYNLGGLEP